MRESRQPTHFLKCMRPTKSIKDTPTTPRATAVTEMRPKMRLWLAILLSSLLCGMVKAKLGDVCTVDSECPDNGECFEEQCACKSGFFPDDSDRSCKVALGEQCSKSADCGINTKCRGDPKVCKCASKDFVNEKGRCGKKLGGTCTQNSDCVRYTFCDSNSICSGCYYGYVETDGFCAKNHHCDYYLKRASLEKFYETITNAFYHYDVFPCRSRLASFRCAGYDVEVTVDHGVTLKTNFNAKDSTGGVYVRDINVTLTKASSDGTVTSQINRINTDDFDRYLKKGDFDKTPWDWSYTGPKPARKQRVIGTATQYTADVIKDALSVRYSPSYLDLDIKCYDRQMAALTDPYQTICGFAGDRDYGVKKELESKSANGSDVRWVLEDYIALAKQDVQQPDATCQEARAVVTGPCEDLGGALNFCQPIYTTKWVSSTGRCLRRNSIDSFKVYLGCLKLKCNAGGNTQEDCDLYKTARDVCGVSLYALANC